MLGRVERVTSDQVDEAFTVAVAIDRGRGPLPVVASGGEGVEQGRRTAGVGRQRELVDRGGGGVRGVERAVGRRASAADQQAEGEAGQRATRSHRPG